MIYRINLNILNICNDDEMINQFREIKEEIMHKINNLNEKYHLYSHATIRGIVVERDGFMKMAHSAMILEPEGAERIELKIGNIEQSELIHFETSFEIEQLNQILENIISKEQFCVGDLVINMNSPGKMTYQWEFRNDSKTSQSEYHYGISHGLSEYFIRSSDQWGHLQLNLKSLRIFALDSYEKIIWKYVFNQQKNFPRNNNVKSDCGIYLLIPNYQGEIDKVEVIDKKIKVLVKKGNKIVPFSDLSLTLDVKNTDWTPLAPNIFNPLKNECVELEISEDIGIAEAILWWNKGESEADSFIDRKEGVRPKDIRKDIMVAHECFDVGFSKLKEALICEDKESIKFEWGVARLLHLCGFQVEWISYRHGKKKIEEIDILAYLPNQSICLAIECTTKQADFYRKISGLSQRSDKLNEKLKSFSILPIIFTNVNNIGSVIEFSKMAGKQGMIIITCERIKELWAKAKDGTSSNEIIKIMTRWKSY